jgi:hypothetical protein
MGPLAILLCLQTASPAIQDLSSPDPDVRNAAVETLVQRGVPIVPEVSRLLNSEDPDLSNRALEVLRKIGLPAIPPLQASDLPKAKEAARRIAGEKAAEVLTEGGNYTIEWRDAPAWNARAAVEMAGGSGHGFSLTWFRIRPESDGMHVLRLTYKGSRKPYTTRWSPDEAPVTAASAVLGFPEYESLLRVVGVIGAAAIHERSTNRYFSVSSNFYSFLSVTSDGKAVYEDEFSGYPGTMGAPEYAKVRAATGLLEKAVQPLPWKDRDLDAADRAWVSERFARDWRRIVPHAKSYWWVQEDLLILVGAAGDSGALPQLTEIIRDGDPADRKTYYAINAATRLIGKDVRPRPLEDMDLTEAKTRILPLLEKK